MTGIWNLPPPHARPIAKRDLRLGTTETRQAAVNAGAAQAKPRSLAEFSTTPRERPQAPAVETDSRCDWLTALVG